MFCRKSKSDFNLPSPGHFWGWVITVVALLMLTSCYMDVGKSTSKSPFTTSTTATPSSTADTCVNCTKVGNSLVKGMAGLMAFALFDVLLVAGCDVGGAAVVALSFFDWMTPGLVDTVDADKPLLIAPYMARYAVEALNKPDFVLPAGKTKEDMIKTIVNGLFKGVGSNTGYGLTTAEQQTLLGSFVSSAVVGLNEAGVADKGVAVAAVASAMIGNLDDAGMTADNFSALGKDLMSSLVSSIKSAGITDITEIGSSISLATRAAVGAFGDAGVTDQTQLEGMIDMVSQGAVVGLSSLELTHEQQMQISADIAEGATQGMTDAGYDAAAIEAHKAKLNSDITSGLESNGVSSTDTEEAKKDIQDKIDQIITGIGK